MNGWSVEAALQYLSGADRPLWADRYTALQRALRGRVQLQLRRGPITARANSDGCPNSDPNG